MTKYTGEFKLKVVKEYLQGNISYRSLCKKHQIPSMGGLKGWVAEYRLKGESAFAKVTKEKQFYSQEFKESAVQLYLTSELTYKDVSFQMGIPTLGLLCTWVNQFRKYGEIPEPKKHGRRREREYMPDKEASNATDQQRIKELERQLRYAQIEVEYLKGLRRLGKRVQPNKKQSSFTISEKNSNSKKS
ncbi:transposase [Lactococcus garvieae subsp. garvieae]|uniref:transposase n=1 Tax=Lactococcus garvieae TaxID=1363 RepID=UPI0005AA97DF|nr:transposase [Lactococcus garvieae]KAA8713357.1 transposase [Lactococcus garvieae subsp. garvieae]MDG6192349.1 transposase [Lactococcus garvieae]QPR48025.1 transposase [Lactococcus garvieae]